MDKDNTDFDSQLKSIKAMEMLVNSRKKLYEERRKKEYEKWRYDSLVELLGNW